MKPQMDKIVYAEEKEHENLTELYRTAGLEIGEGWTEVCHPVFSISARQEGMLLGAATVSHRFRRLVLDYLAVEVPVRGLGIGKKLTELCLDYVRGIGGSRNSINASMPGKRRTRRCWRIACAARITGRTVHPRNLCFI